MRFSLSLLISRLSSPGSHSRSSQLVLQPRTLPAPRPRGGAERGGAAPQPLRSRRGASGADCGGEGAVGSGGARPARPSVPPGPPGSVLSSARKSTLAKRASELWCCSYLERVETKLKDGGLLIFFSLFFYFFIFSPISSMTPRKKLEGLVAATVTPMTPDG